MKQILFMAMLVIASLSAKAQTFINHNGCAIEYRQICINPITCGYTYVTTTWTTVSATFTPLVYSACSPGMVTGWEVRFPATPGCMTNPSVFIYDVNSTLSCPGIVAGTSIPGCGCGVNAYVHYNQNDKNLFLDR